MARKEMTTFYWTRVIHKPVSSHTSDQQAVIRTSVTAQIYSRKIYPKHCLRRSMVCPLSKLNLDKESGVMIKNKIQR